MTRAPARRPPARRPAAVLLVLAAVAAGCGGRDDAAPAPAEGVVVASFDFSESRVLAEIYAQALEDEGFTVRRELDLGPRELVLPALRQGFVDVVPEYVGSALDAVAPEVDVDRLDAAAVRDALGAVVEPWGLAVLEPAAASNQNAVVVTDATADRLGLAAVSDLRGPSPTLVLGGPPECPTRPRCLLGLERAYGLRFAEFLPLSGERLVKRALDDGVIDVGVLFTTDGVLAGDSLVVLRDDAGLQPVDNVVPLARADTIDADPAIGRALDEVSAALATTDLRFLNWRVVVAGGQPADEARGWLVRRGLIHR